MGSALRRPLLAEILKVDMTRVHVAKLIMSKKTLKTPTTRRNIEIALFCYGGRQTVPSNLSLRGDMATFQKGKDNKSLSHHFNVARSCQCKKEPRRPPDSPRQLLLPEK